MRYFVYGYYGFGNIGDDLLLHSLIAGIRRSDSTARFWVRSYNSVPGFEADDHVVFLKTDQVLMSGGCKITRFIGYLFGLIRHLNRVDCLVIGGGGLFLDKGRLNVSLCVLFTLMLWAKLRKLRVVLVGVGVDIMVHPLSLLVTRWVFALADFIAVRDAFTLSYVPPRSKGKTTLAADLILSSMTPARALKRQRDRPRLVFSFIDYYRTSDFVPSSHEAYREMILRFLEANRSTYDLFGIALQSGLGQRDDWLKNLVASKYPEIGWMKTSACQNPDVLSDNADIIVSTRYHLALLGVMAGLPVVVIDHELKMTSLATEFQLPCLPLAEFISGEFIDLEEARRSFDGDFIRCRLERLRVRAQHNFSWLGSWQS